MDIRNRAQLATMGWKVVVSENARKQGVVTVQICRGDTYIFKKPPFDEAVESICLVHPFCMRYRAFFFEFCMSRSLNAKSANHL